MRRRELLSNLLTKCSSTISISQLHCLLIRAGILPHDNFFATKLVSSYAILTSLYTARKLFDEIPHPNTHLFNAILRANSRAKQWDQTTQIFRRMIMSTYPDVFTLPIVLKACAAAADISLGRAVHGLVVRNSGAVCDMFVGAALVEMYAKCGAMIDALKVFEGFSEPDVVLCTSMVTGYQQNGEFGSAVSFYRRMVVESYGRPDPVTLISLISALVQLGDISSGKACHGCIMRMGFEHDTSLLNSLLNLYSKLDAIDAAKNLFNSMPKKDVITWSTMVSCYTRHGKVDEALNVYKTMSNMKMELNSITVVSALQACAMARDLQEGKKLHDLVVLRGLETDVAVSTSLIDMYMKCSCHSNAAEVFVKMPSKDVVSWAAMIGGYTDNGLTRESSTLFKRMLWEGMKPDAVIMVKVLLACSKMRNFQLALCLHGYLVSCGFNKKVFVCAALLDSYSECGSLDDAVEVFECITEKDLVLWSSIIDSLGNHGRGNEALEMFDRMVKSSITPNNVTFISVLSACNHSGMVDEGRRIYNSMRDVYGVEPNKDHCGIMVDMLGRFGRLHEALRIIEDMPSRVGPNAWCALLAGCRIHQNVEIGELAAKNLLNLEPNHAGYYNLLSNLYANEGKWGNVAEVKKMIAKRGIIKAPGYSSVEVSN